MTYPDTWCIAGRATEEALEQARSLLARGDRVVIVSSDVSSCALLVADFGDSVLTVQADPCDVESSEAAVAAIAAAMGELTHIRVVPEVGGPLRVDVTTLALRWPRASIAILENEVADEAPAA